MNNTDQNKKNKTELLEKYKVELEELKPEKDELGKKYAKLESECKSLEKEVKRRESGYQGDEQAHEEYLEQSKEFDAFRWLRIKDGTQLANRFAQVNIQGKNYLADRSMPKVFLRTLLTYLTNFDAPNVTQITNAFAGRAGANALVANTGTANNPTKNSAEWLVQEWTKYNNYAKHMIAVGKRADISKEAEVVMPGVLAVRNVASYISKHANNRTNINAVLDGSESFIPYCQQVHVQNSNYTYYDIKEYDLLKFLEFLFPADLAVKDNGLINLQTGQNANTANDYRLSSGTNDHTLLDKDYKNTVLFPLYEVSTSEVKTISTTHELEDKNIDLEWKFKEGNVDKWISKRYVHEFRNETTNNLNKFEGVVKLFNEIFGNTQTQIRQWVMDTSGWNSTTNTYDNQVDKLSALRALFEDNYNANKNRMVFGNDLIPCLDPNQDDYLTKQEELEEEKIQRDDVKKDYDLVLARWRLISKTIAELEKELGKSTKKDKNALTAKLKSVHNRIDAKWNTSATPPEWTTKTTQKHNWEFWSNFTTDYDDYLELLDTDETKWESKEKELINTHLKNGTYKYFKEVIEVNYNKLTANYNKFVAQKALKAKKTIEDFFAEWLKNKDNGKEAEKIVKDLEALKNYLKLEEDELGNILKKINESDLIRTDLESALKRVLDTDYKPSIKAKWIKTDFATGSKFWDLVKLFYLKTDQEWKDHVKDHYNKTNDSLKDWLKDTDLDVEQFVACIRLYQINKYVNSNAESRKEQREKQGAEILNWFAEVDKLGFSYEDIVSSKNSDFTAAKAYEELKNKIMGSLDEALGLDKKKDSETIQKWVNFKEYSTNEKIEALFKELWEEVASAKEGDKPTKKIKAEFLTYIGQATLEEFLKEKEPVEVVATVKRFEIKDVKVEEIEVKEPKPNSPEFENEKKQITTELEKIKANLEEIEKIGQTLTAEETKLKTIVAAKLAQIQGLKGKEEAPQPKDKGEETPVQAKDTDDKEKTQEPAQGHLAQHWWKYALGLVGLVGIAMAAWYFLKGDKGKESEDEESENSEEN